MSAVVIKQTGSCGSNPRSKKGISLSLMTILGFAMSLVYISLGIYLLTAKNIFSFSNLQQSGFAIILILYGLFRFYQTLKKKKESESDEDNEE